MSRVCATGVTIAALTALLGCSGSDASGSDSGGSSNATPNAGSGGMATQSQSPTTVMTTEKFGETHIGDGTYYTFADGSGACLYDKTSDVQIAALNGFDWQGSAWCGACADVTGPSGNQVRVRIVDLCPDCAKGQLDFHPDAFAMLAPKEQGRIAISWSFVACDTQGPVSYKFKDGSLPDREARNVQGWQRLRRSAAPRLQLLLEWQRFRRWPYARANQRGQWRDSARHLA
jgi:expansin